MIMSPDAPKVTDSQGLKAEMEAVMAKIPSVQIYIKYYLLNLKT